MITHQQMITILNNHGITPTDQAHSEIMTGTSFYDQHNICAQYNLSTVRSYLGY